VQHEIADVRSTPTGQTLWPVPEARPCVTANLPDVRRNLHAPPSVTLLARSRWKRAPSQYYAAGSEPSRVLATQGVDQSRAAVPRLRLYRSLPLLLIGRLSNRHSHRGLIVTGCLAGIAYYLGLAFASGPIMLIGLQLLNAWSFAGIAGIGLPLFQQMIPRPGLSTGLYMNPPDRLYRVRPHHRDRLAHRARATRHLPHQRRPHSDRTDHHHHRQPNNNQASSERSEGPRVHWRLNSGFPTSTVVSRLGSWVSA
jgi:hypothetical protein